MQSPDLVALRRSHENLAELVGSLTPNQIRGRSYNSEWTIAQTLSHLGSGAEIFIAMVERARAGGVSEEHDLAPAVWEAWNARTPEQQADDVVAVDGAVVRAFEEMSDDEAAALRFSIAGMGFDAAGMVMLRLGEHAVHTWDCAVMIDPEATVEPLAVAQLIDRLGVFAGYVGKPTGRITRVRISTTDPDREFVLDATEQVSLNPWVPGEPLRRLIMPTEAFLRLVYGRLDAEHTPDVHREGVELDELRPVFPGF